MTDYIEKRVKELKQIDKECGDMLEEIYSIYNAPRRKSEHFKKENVIKYVKNHPNGEEIISLLCEGYPMHLIDRSTDKLCKKVSNQYQGIDQLRAMLKCNLQEAREGWIWKGKGHYIH